MKNFLLNKIFIIRNNTFFCYTPYSSDSNLIKTGGLLSCVRGQHGHERQRSRSFTPLRKLSATTFEAGGLATPILATTSDGQPSFLRTTTQSIQPGNFAFCAKGTKNAKPVNFTNFILLGHFPKMGFKIPL